MPCEKPKPRTSVACTCCRVQHLRCDSGKPSCSRCTSLGRQCVYQDVRRHRRELRLGQAATANAPGRNHAASLMGAVESVEHVGGAVTPMDLSLEPRELASVLAHFSSSAQTAADSHPKRHGPLMDGAIDAFYAHFFRAHPFVLPLEPLLAQHITKPGSLDRLIPIMKYIGALYIHSSQSSMYWQAVEQTLDKPIPANGFSVQALMLFALSLEWTGKDERASAILHRAKDMALKIRLHCRSFATEESQGDSVLEESWRRTWWELYIVDALFAGIRHQPTFSLWSVQTDVDVPCEEANYMASDIPPARTLVEYDNRGFADTEQFFSSYAYAIDATRILGTTLAAGDIAGVSPSSLVKNAEANILSWDLHLPKCKRDVVLPDGLVDEMMFRAHLIINTVAAHLHRPRSHLHYSTMELLCSKYAPPLPAEILPPGDQHQHRHTHKAIHAATTFIDVISVPSPSTAHTPFIMCMGSLAMATHLSACEYVLDGSKYEHARDRVRVFLGILKAFEDIWSQASKWSGEMKLMARAVFESWEAAGGWLPDSEVTVTDVSDKLVTRVEDIVPSSDV